MIDPKELRIGNIIKDDRKAKEWRFVTHRIISDLASNPGVDLYHAVDLTEEWLIKFGFENSGNIRKSDSFYFINVGGSECHINPNNGVVWIERDANIFNVPQLIEYVHQIQNLYFALTGTELTIKE